MRPAHMLCAYLLALLPCVPCLPAAAQDSGSYVDVSGYPLPDAHYEAWINLRHGLEAGFDQICGDTFCESEFSNIQSLRYRCSVNQVTGRIGMCAWMFAGSNEEINPANGRIAVSQRGFWRCRTPLVPGTTFEELLAALQGDDPLYAPLPNSTTTVMDGLIDCL